MRRLSALLLTLVALACITQALHLAHHRSQYPHPDQTFTELAQLPAKDLKIVFHRYWYNSDIQSLKNGNQSPLDFVGIAGLGESAGDNLKFVVDSSHREDFPLKQSEGLAIKERQFKEYGDVQDFKKFSKVHPATNYFAPGKTFVLLNFQVTGDNCVSQGGIFLKAIKGKVPQEEIQYWKDLFANSGLDSQKFAQQVGISERDLAAGAMRAYDNFKRTSHNPFAPPPKDIGITVSLHTFSDKLIVAGQWEGDAKGVTRVYPHSQYFGLNDYTINSCW